MLKRSTEALFLLTVFSLPFVRPGLPIGAGLRTQYSEIAFLAAAALFAAAFAFGAVKLRKGCFYLPVGLYVGAAAISAIFSEAPRTSGLKLAGIAYLAGLAVLAFNLAGDADLLKKTVYAWLAATAVVAGYALFVLAAFYLVPGSEAVKYGLSHYGTFPPGNYPRIQSLFANPNMFCNYLSVSWVALLGAYGSGWIGRLPAGVIGGMIVVSAAFTLSPGIGAFFFCTGIWFWYTRRNESGWLPRLAMASGVGVAVMFLAVTAVKFDSGFSLSSEPSARYLTWTSSIRNLAENPFTGKGVGTMAADVRYEHQRLRDAHNTYLNVGAESGLIGLGAVVFFSWWFPSRAVRASAYGGSRGKMAFALGLGFAGAFVYQGLAGSFEDARHLWVLAGLIGAVAARDFTEEADG